MKKLFAISLLATIMLFIQNNADAQTSTTVLRHIVIITFKQDAPADSIQALDNLYISLSKSPLVKDFEWGVNMSTRDTGVVKHIYATSFASKEDIDNYRKLPDYPKLFKLSLPVADDVTVADYWAKK
ncbi:MAG TPA: Dabb family protein [Parafilimonas sp.]|nr:Dabb family protein [Parafilimonas sp.]